MSAAVFPSLAGLGWDIVRTPIWDTTIQTNTSGKETRVANQTYPRWQWELTFDMLRQGTVHGSVYSEFAQLAGFFNSRRGSFDSFLYDDADDRNVSGQLIGLGNGSQSAFQLVRSFGGFIEPVLAPNAVSVVYLNGLSIPGGGIAAPVNGALTSTTAGALAATTYYVKTTWRTPSGETLPSAETSLVVAANKVLNVARPSSPPPGAYQWVVYVSNTAMGGSGAEQYQSVLALSDPSWVEPTSGLINLGVTPPAANTTGWLVNPWGTADSNGPGVLRFAGPVANSVAITADFNYYWPCRFVDDQVAFNKFVSNLYAGKKLAFISVKN